MAIRTRSLVLLGVAVATGTVAAYLAFGYLRQQARPLLNVASNATRAAVAARDLPVGTIVTEQDVRMVEWPGDALPPGLISSADQVVGRGIILPMRLNAPFLESNLGPREGDLRSGLPFLISEGMRALSLSVDQVIGVAGFVVPGTRVDVLLTMQDRTPSGEPTTKIILQNIPALAAAQSIQIDPEGKPQQVPVITLLVTPEQAETLALASGQGRIQLTLRNALDTLLVRTSGARMGTLITGGRAPPAPPGWRRAASPAPTSETITVEGFRGGQRTLTKFSRTRPEETTPRGSADTIPRPEDEDRP
jgi:pilus assembly protein CpaB